MPPRNLIVTIKLKQKWETTAVKIDYSDNPDTIARRVNDKLSAVSLRKFKDNHEILRMEKK